MTPEQEMNVALKSLDALNEFRKATETYSEAIGDFMARSMPKDIAIALTLQVQGAMPAEYTELIHKAQTSEEESMAVIMRSILLPTMRQFVVLTELIDQAKKEVASLQKKGAKA